jgi:mRNA interferase RelE/StbE
MPKYEVEITQYAERQFKNFRTGDYRVIYEIFDKKLIVQVIEIGHRREIYD